jgi:hypothetical protein
LENLLLYKKQKNKFLDFFLDFWRIWYRCGSDPRRLEGRRRRRRRRERRRRRRRHCLSQPAWPGR